MINVNLYDRCNINHMFPHTIPHTKELGRCWGCHITNLPKTIDFVTDGSGVLDLYRNECMNTANKYGTTDTKILWIREARSIDPMPYELLAKNHRHYFDQIGFKYIYTWDPQLLDLDDRFKWSFGCGASILEQDRIIHEKTKNTSMIASAKTMTPLHYKRLEIVKQLKDKIPIYGTAGSGWIKNKIDGLRDYRFSVAIENEITGTTISEKIMDCFVTGTVPVFLGSDLPTHLGFTEEGIIRWSDDLNIDSLDENRYNEMYEAVKQNYEVALNYINPADYTFGVGGFYWNEK